VTITVQVRGLEELKRELARLGEVTAGRLARNASMAAARTTANFAPLYVPVRTGRLKASIKARRPKGRALRGRAASYANAAARHAWLVEYGTKHSAARSYLRRAIDEHQVEIYQKIVENLSNGIRRELAKQSVPEDPGEI
jgi:HK97 gp10 family phage protein